MALKNDELRKKQEFLEGYYLDRTHGVIAPPEKRNEIKECIDALRTWDMRVLLRRRYMQNQKWREIQEAMFLSKTACERLHKMALEQLEIPEVSVTAEAADDLAGKEGKDGTEIG